MIAIEQVRRVGSFQLMSSRGRDPALPPAAGLGPQAAKTIRQVAIVEDELMVAWTLESTLEDLGYEVVGMFSNGEDAIAALQNRSVDLICMDVNLGRGIDGIEAVRRIRERQSAAILFITAYSDDATIRRIHEAAPEALVIGKPTTRARLEQAIAQLTHRTN